MTEKTSELIEAVRREAERSGFPIDAEVYERSGRDPNLPIMFAGALDAPLCIVGRDLGKDEVRAGQPPIGAAGRLVRFSIRVLRLARAYFSVTGVASRIIRANSELLRVAYCEEARYVTCMIIPVLPIM
jgi:uracil-DNA glycosylase